MSAATAHDHAHEHGHGHGHDHGGAVAGAVPADALIAARGLGVDFGRRAVLDGIDLDVRPGEIVTLIGPNGAGKTTLVSALLGLVPPARGRIERRAGLVIGYVPQRFDISRTVPLSVNRFLQLGSRNAGATADALAEVGAQRVAQSQLADLSGGEFQRVLLARALIRNPSLLVLDEPVRGVDYTGQAEVYDLVARLRDQRGLAVLLVSHDLHFVMARSDRVLCINRHICCSGVPAQVAQSPAYAALFGPDAAQAVAVYRHAHDHRHDLAGAPLPPA